jgi:hypothetical protein
VKDIIEKRLQKYDFFSAKATDTEPKNWIFLLFGPLLSKIVSIFGHLRAIGPVFKHNNFNKWSSPDLSQCCCKGKAGINSAIFPNLFSVQFVVFMFCYSANKVF